MNAAARIQTQTAIAELHWPEYAIEAALLGAFMVSACVVTALLEHPFSPLPAAIPDSFARRALIGLAMGLTAIGLIYSPWGRQSGAHFNPSVTMAFLRLGKIAPWDAAFYTAAQFAGATVGVVLAALVLGSRIADPAVGYAVTVPGPAGPSVAFLAEAAISFGLMTLVLVATTHPRVARFTGILVGLTVAAYIGIEAPFSGMSMNPARTFGSAVVAQVWTAFWLYVAAPVAGMLAAAEVHRRRRGDGAVGCAKLHHQNDRRCIHCEGREARRAV